MNNKELISRLVDADIIERIRWIGRQSSDFEWEVGDTAILIWWKILQYRDQLLTGEIKVPSPETEAIFAVGEMDVYSFVGENFGRSSRTIRAYVRVCSHYKQDTREKYDVLPFSHFEYALEMGDKWEKVLNASVDQMDRNGGKPPSVDWLRSNFTGISQVDRACQQLKLLDDVNQIPQVIADMTRSQSQPDLPPPAEPQPANTFILRVIAQAVRPIEKYVENDDIPGPVARALRILIDALREALVYEIS